MLTMALFLMGLLLAVGFMVYTARKTNRESRYERRHGSHRSTGFIGGTPFLGTGEIGPVHSDNSGWGGDSGGSWGGGGDGGGSGGGS